MSRTLYLGLRPKPGCVHYPVIKTIPLGNLEQALSLWSRFTHVIFTSQTAVLYWPGPWDKQIIAIGQATAQRLCEKGLDPLVAKEATQEGIMQQIQDIDGYFFLPQSRLARPNLAEFLKSQGKPFFSLDLYDTVYQKLEPVPDLNAFDEIIFTSPSTVEGFCRIFQSLPTTKKLVAIGPITERALLSRKEHLHY